ncbi:hypothetical protein ACTXT7_004226 [Hymenolepis weldensis]
MDAKCFNAGTKYPCDCYKSTNLKCSHIERALVISDLFSLLDGVSRAGVFCAISICMERILAQSEVDVFRAVEIVKQNRPQLVTDLGSASMQTVKDIKGINEKVEPLSHTAGDGNSHCGKMMEYKQCYNCAIRMITLLAGKIKANEQEHSRDPIEIFDELDRKRAEGEFRPELIDTTGQPSRQGSRRSSLESNEHTLKKSINLSGSGSLSSSPSPTLSSCSSHTSLTDFHPIEAPKRKLPVVYQNSITRRLPPVNKISERPMLIPKRPPQVSIPILRSHRILPGGGNAARRQLPTLHSIIENPLDQSHFLPLPPSTQVKKILPSMINKGPSKDGIISNTYSTLRCNGGQNLGDSLTTPRHPLIRTETETTYLTSSLGEPHQIS